MRVGVIALPPVFVEHLRVGPVLGVQPVRYALVLGQIVGIERQALAILAETRVTLQGEGVEVVLLPVVGAFHVDQHRNPAGREVAQAGEQFGSGAFVEVLELIGDNGQVVALIAQVVAQRDVICAADPTIRVFLQPGLYGRDLAAADAEQARGAIVLEDAQQG